MSVVGRPTCLVSRLRSRVKDVSQAPCLLLCCVRFPLRALEKGLFQDYENRSLHVKTDLSVHFRVTPVSQAIRRREFYLLSEWKLTVYFQVAL